MGLGHVELAMVQAEAAKASYGPFVLNCQAPDEGNMHTLLHWATDEQKEKYLRPLCDGHDDELLRDDRAGGRRLRPDADPDHAPCRTATSGSSTATSGSSPTPAAPRSRSCIARTEDDPDLPQAANTAFIVDIPSDGLEPGARGRDDARRHAATARSSSRTCACPTRTCSAGAARATCSASTGSGRRGWRTACAGSPRPRRRST